MIMDTYYRDEKEQFRTHIFDSNVYISMDRGEIVIKFSKNPLRREDLKIIILDAVEKYGFSHMRRVFKEFSYIKLKRDILTIMIEEGD